jgi:UDP-3-O-[3-hydroxymyristoyl] glucosamine N-acyltransferase
MSLTIAQLAKRLSAELAGRADIADRQICAVGPVKTAGESEVTFISDNKYKAALSGSRAGAVIVSEHLEGLDKP